ncbi:sugar transferase [Maribacter aestuarii]|uniref:sugar transferase n=1 Tax=Maribacter aestuarii TaxID=1130723 RepID=UPI00248AFFC1|nr:sugar transferase [Maribacter aestuarii]
MYSIFFKPVIDVIVSVIGFITLLPIFLIVYVVLTLINKGRPIFFQSRPGKNEKEFVIMKFKTMNDKKDVNGKLLPDNERMTKFGSFLRKSSLDEIPQLLNVIKGDMSLVGPRPLRMRYLPFYTNREKIRHSVKPGITGLAQVSGRNSLNWDQKLELDVIYVKNLSFYNDFKILLKTLKKIMNASDIDLNEEMHSFDEYRARTIKPFE